MIDANNLSANVVFSFEKLAPSSAVTGLFYISKRVKDRADEEEAGHDTQFSPYENIAQMPLQMFKLQKTLLIKKY